MNLSSEKHERRSQILINVRSLMCESLIFTRAFKMIIMKSLTISAHEKQSHDQVNRMNQTKKTLV